MILCENNTLRIKLSNWCDSDIGIAVVCLQTLVTFQLGICYRSQFNDCFMMSRRNIKYKITTTALVVVATAESGDERLIFPYLWHYGIRTYTFASINGTGPTHGRLKNGFWVDDPMKLETFTHWIALLEALPNETGAMMEIRE